MNLFEPELVVIGGGVSRRASSCSAPVRERVRAEAIGSAGRDGSTIVAAALGDAVGVVGAAASRVRADRRR